MEDYLDLDAPAPYLAPRSLGSRLVLYPSATGEGPEFAIGMEPNCMWFNTLTTGTNTFKFYFGSVMRFMFEYNYLTLPAAPTQNMHAATKQYVDSNSGANKLNLDGSNTMTGSLNMSGNGANSIRLTSASQKYFTFADGGNVNRWRIDSYNSNNDRFDIRANTNAGTFDVVMYIERQS